MHHHHHHYPSYFVGYRYRYIDICYFVSVSLYSHYAYYLANDAVRKTIRRQKGEQQLLRMSTTALQCFSNFMNHLIEQVSKKDKERKLHFYQYQQFYFSETINVYSSLTFSCARRLVFIVRLILVV